MSVMNVDYDKLRIILMPHVLRQGGLLEALFTALTAAVFSTLFTVFCTGVLSPPLMAFAHLIVFKLIFLLLYHVFPDHSILFP